MTFMNQIIPINLGIVYAYLVKGKDRSVLVDCGFPGQENSIMRALAKNGVKKHDVSVIVVTHGDIDHYGSSGRLRELLGAPVLVHEADSGILRTGVNRKIHPTTPVGKMMKTMALFLTALTKNRYRPFEPDVIMRGEEFNLDKYGVDGYLLHTPGETAGSISMVLPGKQIIAGDLIGGIFPHSSVPAYAPFKDDLAGVKNSLKRVLGLGPLRIYTGHSRPIDVKKHLQRLRDLSN
jgi:hydroxyacylglutathione hydrolase